LIDVPKRILILCLLAKSGQVNNNLYQLPLYRRKRNHMEGKDSYFHLPARPKLSLKRNVFNQYIENGRRKKKKKTRHLLLPSGQGLSRRTEHALYHKK